MHSNTLVFQYPRELALEAAKEIVRLVSGKERPSICLAGGSSPKLVYEALGGPLATKLDWNRLHWFIGDERFVSLTHPDSNFGMAKRIFLDAQAPRENQHPTPIGAADHHEASRQYEEQLQLFYGSTTFDQLRPLFDVVILGVGRDGHTASLFPNDPALEEERRWAVGIDKPGLPPIVPRISLTLPALSSCESLIILAVGADKAGIMSRVSAGEQLPITRPRGIKQTIWFVDDAAASDLSRGRQ